MHATTTTSARTASTTATSSTSASVQSFVDPDDLICPGCAEQVRCAPPVFWQVADGSPVAEFSHQDRTPLCRTRGGQVAEPVEVA